MFGGPSHSSLQKSDPTSRDRRGRQALVRGAGRERERQPVERREVRGRVRAVEPAPGLAFVFEELHRGPRNETFETFLKSCA